jgi:glycosyltransferase involved in cell wall biosynthesis
MTDTHSNVGRSPGIAAIAGEGCRASRSKLTSRWAIALRLLMIRAREWLVFDSRLFRSLAAFAGTVAGVVAFAVLDARRGFALLSKVHQSNFAGWSNCLVEQLVRSAARDGWSRRRLWSAYERHVESATSDPRTAKFFEDPRRLLGPLVMVLKSPGENEKGVINLLYLHVHMLFLKLFDIERVAERYHVVLEPSWSGYCNPDVLCYSRYPFPVFVQAYEPRDYAFVRDVGGNLVPAPVSNNWWVDHRTFRPVPGVGKDVDLIMVASWADWKRHDRFFAALARLRLLGLAAKTVLIGYPMGRTKEDILHLAAYHGVLDQIELYEHLTPEQVAHFMARASVNVIWSRKEGVNRTILEGLFSDTPGIMREGFNYGYKYDYINEKTGCFSSEAALPETLARMLKQPGAYAPRAWVMEHMTCQKATEILSGAIREASLALGQAWTRDLAQKVNRLNGQAYWEESDRERFAADYAYLAAAIRQRP